MAVNENKAPHEEFHAMAAEAVLDAMKADPNGLSTQEAENRLQSAGPNRLPEPPKRSALLRFLRHFHNILIYVLLGSALITATLGRFIDTAVILAVVVVNAVIGLIQEGRAEKAMDAIRKMLAPKASVLRNGERRTVDGAALVPGDIVLLEAGDRVPADLRLLHSNGLQIQEAILTGESVPVEKDVRPVNAGAPLGDRACLAFSGTLVTSGLGRGVVVATGANTEIGRISGMLSTVEVLTTPLIQQMNAFARWLTVLILLIAGLLLVFGLFVRHIAFADLFMAVVGLCVAAIPEGLPAVLTITLAVGVRAMAQQNAIVRRLPAIETLGSVSVICTDKTGTLTRNEMAVVSVVTNAHFFAVEGSGYEPRGAIKLDGTPVTAHEHDILKELGLAAVFGIHAYANERGYSIELARTLAVNTLVVFEIFHLFFIRNIYGTSLTWKLIRGTKVVWATVFAVTIAQFGVTYLPVLQSIFLTEPVSLRDGILIVGLGITLFAILETEKQIRLRMRQLQSA